MKAFFAALLKCTYSVRHKGADAWRAHVVTAAGWISFVALVWTLAVAAYCHLTGKAITAQEALPYAAFWALAPPLWFWMEYHWLWQGSAAADDVDAFAQFAHSQECSRNLWAGLVGLLLAVYFSGALAGEGKPQPGTCSKPSPTTVMETGATPVDAKKPADNQTQ